MAKGALAEEWTPEELRTLDGVKSLWHAASTNEKYFVISPDGLPITPAPFEWKSEAIKFTRAWWKRFEQQGYYAAVGRRIPLDKLCNELTIVPESHVDEAMREVIEHNKQREEGREHGRGMGM